MKPSVLITGAIVLTGWMFIDGYKTDAGKCDFTVSCALVYMGAAAWAHNRERKP